MKMQILNRTRKDNELMFFPGSCQAHPASALDSKSPLERVS
jgi:hypothetical protein